MRMTIILLLMCCSANSADFMWLGETGNWSDPNKWTGGSVPDDPNDCAYFPEGNYTVFITNPVDVRFINGGIIRSESDVRLWSLFNCDYTQVNGSLSTEHIVSSHVGVHTGLLSFANINDSDVNILGAVSVHNSGGLLCDVTGDGKVDLQDLAMMAKEWLNEI